ncbi:DUF3618 domain-containing protein [Aquihabitans sp. McL0605]|uniref:DUF3618 domain-containing protein n=1 Tax=Aquihabitans sp. McL0605 TaxID=3415671 RepID=UPI003CF967C4
MAERTEELRRDIEQTRAHMSGTLDEIGDRVSPGRIAERRWQSVRESGSRVAATVMGAPRSATQRTGSAIGDAQSSASDAASSAAQSVAEAPERVKEAASGNPIAAGAVAFGIGVLIGSLASSSPEEQRIAEQFLEPVQSELSDTGRQLASAVKEQVQEQMAPVVEHATEAAAEVKDHAVDSAETIRAEATSAKGAVESDVKDATREARG